MSPRAGEEIAAAAAFGGGRGLLTSLGPSDLQSLRNLKRFLPHAVMRKRSSPDFDGVVVLFDVAGFSTMCERFGGSDEEVEGLSALINDAFGVEIELVEEYEGDVISFLGDGLLAMWSVDPPGDDDGPSLEERCSAAAARAILCTLRVQHVFESRLAAARRSGESTGVELRLRAAVAFGSVREYRCGSSGDDFKDILPSGRHFSAVPGRLVYFVRSEAVSEAGAAAGQCRPGETALCPSVLAHVPPQFVSIARRLDPPDAAAPLPRRPSLSSTPVAAPASPTLVPPLLSLSPPSPSLRGRPSPQPITVPVVARPDTADLIETFLESLRPQPPPSPGQDAVPWDQLALFVPCTVRDRGRPAVEAAPQTGAMTARAPVWDAARYDSEFRSAAVLFAQLEGLSVAPAAVQAAVLAMQRCLYAWGGSLRQITLDDKGLVFIGVFGLWPLAHHDDPARAVQCAVDLRKALESMRVSVQIGVASGLVFCTYVGNATRCEFSVFGSVVNKAARLMAKAGGEEDRCLCDAHSFEIAGSRVPMDFAGMLALKGFKEKVAVYRLAPAKPGGLATSISAEASQRRPSLLASVASSSPTSPFAADGTEPENPPSPLRLATLRRGSNSTPEGSAGPQRGRQGPRLVGRASEAEAVAALVSGLLSTDARRGSAAQIFDQRVAQLARGATAPSSSSSLSYASARDEPKAGLELPRAPSGAAPSVVLVEGGAGLGKTALAAFALRLARGVPNGPAAAASRASETSRAAPFHALRGLFAALFPSGANDMSAFVEPSELPLLPELARLFKLGGAADTGSPPPAKADAGLRGSYSAPSSARGEGPAAQRWVAGGGAGGPALQACMVRLLLRRARAAPLLLVVEDCQIADSQSWAALLALAKAIPQSPGTRLALLVTLRPPDEGAVPPGSMRGALVLASAAAAEKLARVEGVKRLRLGPLEEADVAHLIRDAIKASGVVPPALRSFVHAQSGGVPGIAADLTRALLDRGDVAVDAAGRCLLVRSLREGTRNVSDAVRAAITERLDHLASDQMLLLKLASVVGSHFTVGEVAAMHPAVSEEELASGAAAAVIVKHFAELVRLGIVARVVRGGRRSSFNSIADTTMSEKGQEEDDEEEEGAGASTNAPGRPNPADAAFRFGHKMMREVVYGLVAVPQRRALHGALAALHEKELAEGKQGAADDLETLSCVAHHLLLAGEPRRAAPFLERCARLAVQSNAHVEAVRLYEDLCAHGGAPPARQAEWTRRRAQSLHHLGLYREAMAACRAGLGLLGVAVPSSRAAAVARFAVLSARLSAARLPDPYALPRVAEGAAPASSEASLLFALLATCGERTNEERSVMALCAASAAWEALREAALGPALAYGAAVWAALCAVMRWGRQSARYARLASGCLTQVDRTDVYLAVLPHLAQAEMAVQAFADAEVSVRVWLEVAERSGSLPAEVECLYACAALQRRCPTLPWPGEPAFIAGLLEGVQERAWREAAGMPELHATIAASLLADLLLQQDEAERALAVLETHARACDLPAVALISDSAACGFFCVYAQALLRASAEEQEHGEGDDCDDVEGAVLAGRAPRTLRAACVAAERGVALLLAPEHPRGRFLSARHEVAVQVLYGGALVLFVAWLASEPGAHPAAPFAAAYRARPDARLPPAARLAALALAACERLEELHPHDALRPLALVARGLAKSLRRRPTPASHDFRDAASLARDWRAHSDFAESILGRNRALAVILKALHCPKADAASRARLMAAAADSFRRARDDHYARIALSLRGA